MWGTRGGEPESPITELGSPHISPWAGSHIQFRVYLSSTINDALFTVRQLHREEKSNEPGSQHYGGNSLIIIPDNQKFVRREDLRIMLFPVGLWSLDFCEGNWRCLLFMITTNISLGRQSAFLKNTVQFRIVFASLSTTVICFCHKISGDLEQV